MKLWSLLKSTARNLFRKRQVESLLDEEIQAYVDLETEQRIAAGASSAEARRAALAECGGVEQIKQAVRDDRAGSRLDRLGNDLHYGWRQFCRNPGFTFTVILTLALSIGANTAVFSLVNALLLRSLPYAHPERMGSIYTRITGTISTDERHHLNGEQWELLRDNVPALISGLSSARASGVNLQAGSQVQYVQSGRISAHYLDALATHPIIGRNFSEDEDRPHGPHTAILSYGLWHNTFGADTNIVGQTIRLKGDPYTVIGVLPESATTPLNADLYTPLQASRDGEGAGTNFAAITRLRDGATWQEADAEINRAWSHRANRYELRENPDADVSYYSVPLQKGETDRLRPQVVALMLAAGLILLIACANLAGLTLVRVLRRTPEIATRLALGASRWQILRQLWIENFLRAFVGGAVGIAVGFLALRGLLSLLPEHFLPVTSAPLDIHVLAFTALISILTSVLFGMLPALATRRFDLRSAIAMRTNLGGDHLGLRQTLIAGEVALTVVLLAASGLLVRTLIHLQTLPAGFNPNGVLTAKASLDDAPYRDPGTFRKLLMESTLAMRQIPGVQYAAVGLSLPYERQLNSGTTLSDGQEAGQSVMTSEAYITPDYFAALQIPILLGRSFTDADGPATQPVAIVNQTFAQKFFHGANPVGRYLDKNTRIVGMVADVPVVPGLVSVDPLTGEEAMYVPAAQTDAQSLSLVHVWFQPSWIVRTAAPVEGLTAQMQHALSSVDPNLPFSGFYNMHDLLARALATQRVEVALISTLALLALALSTLGIFALVASVVAQKRREIGLRMALGSSRSKAMLHTGAPGLKASALGLFAGLILSAGTLRAMHSALYGVGVYDVPTMLTVVITLALVALFATIVPTLRIAGIDPSTTLREE